MTPVSSWLQVIAELLELDAVETASSPCVRASVAVWPVADASDETRVIFRDSV